MLKGIGLHPKGFCGTVIQGLIHLAFLLDGHKAKKDQLRIKRIIRNRQKCHFAADSGVGNRARNKKRHSVNDDVSNLSRF